MPLHIWRARVGRGRGGRGAGAGGGGRGGADVKGLAGASVVLWAGGMSDSVKKGDRVSWNTSQGRTRGVVVEQKTADFEFDGQKFTASKDEPAYLVESEKTGARAAHKGSALRKLASKG